MFTFAGCFSEGAVKGIITAATPTDAINSALYTLDVALTLSLTNYTVEFKLDHLNNDKAVKTDVIFFLSNSPSITGFIVLYSGHL